MADISEKTGGSFDPVVHHGIPIEAETVLSQ